MKRAILAMVVAVMGLALAACETMSAEECAVADWRAVGFNDASSNGADRFSARAESCAEKGISADQGAYASGFADGMTRFCQPPNGFQFAMRGGSFSGSCPPDLQYDFYAAYNDGRRVHEAQSEISTAESEFEQLRRRYNNFEEDIRNAQAALNAATTEEDRRRFRDEIEAYRRERRDMEDDLDHAERRVYFARRRLDDLHYDIGARWAPW